MKKWKKKMLKRTYGTKYESSKFLWKGIVKKKKRKNAIRDNHISFLPARDCHVRPCRRRPGQSRLSRYSQPPNKLTRHNIQYIYIIDDRFTWCVMTARSRDRSSSSTCQQDN